MRQPSSYSSLDFTRAMASEPPTGFLMMAYKLLNSHPILIERYYTFSKSLVAKHELRGERAHKNSYLPYPCGASVYTMYGSFDFFLFAVYLYTVSDRKQGARFSFDTLSSTLGRHVI